MAILFWILPALALFLTGCNQKKEAAAPAAEEIVIGQFASLTGSIATFGQSETKGIKMALTEINKAGGIAGRPIRIVLEDDQGKPEEAQTVVTKLINKDRVVVVMGGSASSNSLAAAPVCQASRIPMLSSSSVNFKVTQVGDCIFRVCFTDVFQGEVLADFAASSLAIKDVAIFFDVKTDYSVGLKGYFEKRFLKLGGKVVAEESYSQGDKDFTAQLTSLKSKNPSAIFIPGYYTEVGLIALQARKLGITVPLFGGDGWDSSKLLEIGGVSLNDCYFATHFAVEDPNPLLQQFVTNFKTTYPGETPDAMAALGYDGAMFLFDAIKRAAAPTPDNIRQALADTKIFNGVTGSISLDENRNAIKPATIMQIKDGKIGFKEALKPAPTVAAPADTAKS